MKPEWLPTVQYPADILVVSIPAQFLNLSEKNNLYVLCDQKIEYWRLSYNYWGRIDYFGNLNTEQR